MSDSPVRIATPRLELTLPAPDRAAAVRDYFDRNRSHLGPWGPRQPATYFTEEHWRTQLARNREEHAAGSSLRLFLALRDAPDRVCGTCNLSNFVRGAFQACHLGYGLDAELVGRGLMSEAVEAVVGHAFDVLKLHRVQANYGPENARSGRLLERLGFEREGFARDYLFIDGRWRDHVLTARFDPAWRPPEQPGV